MVHTACRLRFFLVTLLSVFLFAPPVASRSVAAEAAAEVSNANTLAVSDMDRAAAGPGDTEQDAGQQRNGEKEKVPGQASEKKKCGMEPQHKNSSKAGEALDKHPIKPWWWLFRKY